MADEGGEDPDGVEDDEEVDDEEREVAVGEGADAGAVDSAEIVNHFGVGGGVGGKFGAVHPANEIQMIESGLTIITL